MKGFLGALAAPPCAELRSKPTPRQGHVARVLLGPAVARAFQAGDGRDAQHLHAGRGQRRAAVALDHHVRDILRAGQDAAAAVVDDAPRPGRHVTGAGRVMLGGDDDPGRAGIHAEPPRRAARQFEPDFRHVAGADRAVGEGDLQLGEAAILRPRGILCPRGASRGRQGQHRRDQDASKLHIE